MKLSIIIPTYNSFYSLSKTLHSIEKNNFKNYEVIVVDDGSFMSHMGFIDQPNVKYVRLARNHGPSYCRNRGAEIAKGDILVFIDSDIYLEENTLEKIAEYFFTNNVDAITGVYNPLGGCTKFFSRFKNLYMNHNFSNLPLEVNFLLGAVCAIRKTSFTSWDETKRYGEDTALGQELYAKGSKIHLMKDLSVSHLKSYNWKSFFKNNFVIPYNFASIFLKHSAAKQYKESNFSHVSKRQITSIALSGLSLLALVTSVKAFFGIIILFILLNRKFFTFIAKKTNMFFFLASIPIHYIDNIVMGFGIFFGLINSSINRLKLAS